jgi:hypothetical protein
MGDNASATWATTPAQMHLAVAVGVVVIVIIAGLCLLSSLRLKRNQYWNFLWGLARKVALMGLILRQALY